MIRILVVIGTVLSIFTGSASAQTCGTLPYTLTNGTTADATQVMANLNYALGCANAVRGYLGGLTLSNDATNPTTVIGIGAGVAEADDVSMLMRKTTATTKNVNANWAAGSGNGCLAGTSSSPLANTWYHVFLIARTDTGAVDVLCAVVPSTPVMPSSYTKKRRIGSFKTNGSSQIIAFSQNGNEFLWASPPQDVNGTIGTTSAYYTLTSVPSGVKVNALLSGYATSAGSAVKIYLGSGDTPVVTSVGANVTAAATGSGAAASWGLLSIRTDTSQRIQGIAGTDSNALAIATIGYIDTRGQSD